MAPHYSRMSIGAYTKRLQQAIADQGADLEIAAIESWKEDPGYLDCLEERIRAGLAAFAPEARPGVHLVFTAHSLPQRILEWDDPYPAELQATCERLQARFPEQPAHFAYQSAAMTSEPWLGPDAGDRMLELIEDGVQDFLLAPIGFVSEHVEILYDVDIEFKARVTAAGGRLVRIEMPNDHPAMAVSLAGRVRSAAEEAGWL
jgi:ferrochelatase